jgi:signal transduction histidine kinase
MGIPNHLQCTYAVLITVLSLGSLSAHAYSDTTQVYRLIDLADKMNAANRSDSAEHYYKAAGTLAQFLKFDPGYLKYTGHYTGFLYRQSRYKEALAVAKQQLDAGLRTKDKKKTSNAYNNIALQYQALGQMEAAATHLIKALEASENDIENQQKYYTNLGSLFLDLKQYKKGLIYAEKGHELAVLLQDTMKVGRSLVNLLVAETLNNNLQKAEVYALRVIAIGEQYRDSELVLTGLCNLGDIHLGLHKFDASLAIFQRALSLLDKSGPDYAAYVYQGLASTYRHMKKYREADYYFNLAYQEGEKYLPKAEFSTLLLSGAEIKEALGEYKTALTLRKRYQVVNDSLVNASTQGTLHELEIQYKTAEKEAKMAKQANELEKKKQWIMLYTALLALLTAVLLFNRKMAKQREKLSATGYRNKLLKAQLDGEEEERSRTARDLHDGVASVLSAAKLQLHLLPGTAHLGAKNLVDQALQEVRNISHNMAAEIVSSEGLGSAVHSFCLRVSHPGLEINYIQLGDVPQLSKRQELLLYRSIQEAVTNIVKHARATEAIVQLYTESQHLSITIEDNGRGFKQKQKEGIGLRSLASRIKLLNGTMDIHSTPGVGTTVHLEVNLKNKTKPTEEIAI